ncbi:hypothetical protein KC343_g6515 [Hortaea werneckii]|nr:hypothetical protein KC352_g9208 [Hortaea werneckii]KAI7559982.1 hypothetical protein KC317_g10020 [Hortaea werneckii]KAI7605107.1 hypothetical protein KC346_g11167 [Hortaea werneckii]KAI7625779.1 hypothetical protein KC343_g6515 [Hortaea werneckii]KAI7650729.1 hypothetical protein KC319_g11000 [Hortaea werneckii]
MKLLTTLSVITALIALALAAPIPRETPNLTDSIDLAERDPEDPDCAAEAALDATFGGSGECETASPSLAKKDDVQDAGLDECAIEAAIDVAFCGSGKCD